MSYLLLAFILCILLALALGLYHLVFSPKQPESLTKALAIRIGLSLALFLTILTPHIIHRISLNQTTGSIIIALILITISYLAYRPSKNNFYIIIGCLVISSAIALMLATKIL